MPTATQLEILDLRHFTARQLRPLLETEATVWEERLRWNRGSLELLLQYLDSRILPGFVALDRGRVCGFAFCVYEGHKASRRRRLCHRQRPCPGPPHHQHPSRPPARPPPELPQHQPHRIPAPPTTPAPSTKSSSAPGFTMHPRLFMEYNFPLPEAPSSASTATNPRPSISPKHRARPLVHRLLPGRSRAHPRILHRPHRRPHQRPVLFPPRLPPLFAQHSPFPAAASSKPTTPWVLRDRITGALTAMVLCSRVADNVAHITQLCVRTTSRGHHYGRKLLEHCMSHLLRLGLPRPNLTVTEANQQAVKLYEGVGFFTPPLRRHGPRKTLALL